MTTSVSDPRDSRLKACAGCSTIIDTGKFCDSCQPKRHITMAELRPKELQVIELIAGGAKSSVAAEVMGESENWVNNKLQSICIRLGITAVTGGECQSRGNRRIALTLAWLEYRSNL